MKKMYEVQMYVDGKWWPYGKWSDANRANEVAMEVRDERDVWVQVVEVWC